ncbi:thioredoxin-disulfide reductase [Wolbachia endosymbiont of Howardula sp.]|uniref:thioredoxin-disulfide reductase n=1 Tax=Wolbachia endosymbiont of Howardula sp. TaxID=2916816 RepID=UPI00217DDD64|nr:thioredoxin-disulfide reductase [Wolbachia endosymbiont of Howardula sp.]UWI83258.1 thioredoxin-disulfide reductase [Wolbachia endosymbiont of Howardula sp.]
MHINTEVLIIGSGIAGYSAAIYASRAQLSPIVITGLQSGGQLMMTTDVENYPGFISVQGPELMVQMRLHAEKVGAQIIDDTITHINQFKEVQDFQFCASGEYQDYHSKSVIIASGAQAKTLNLESEKQFQGYGVSYCATCDGAFFKNKVVAVIGGGDTAVEEAIFLTRFTKSVILIHRSHKLRAAQVTQNQILKNKKITVMLNYTVQYILGISNPHKVTGLIIKSNDDDVLQELQVEGVFIAIGHIPNTSVFKSFIDLDQNGYIVTKPGTTLTSRLGVFAAGDVQDHRYRQAVVAAGSGCMAALDVEKFLELLN